MHFSSINTTLLYYYIYIYTQKYAHIYKHVQHLSALKAHTSLHTISVKRSSILNK